MRKPLAIAGALVSAAVVAVVHAGCGLAPKGPVRDPNARPPSPSRVNGPSFSHRPAATPPVRTAATSATRFSGEVAVACNGTPTSEQVISLLRRHRVITAQQSATASTGPLCSGTWQYTVVSVPGADPMNVVTRGAPNALTLITAGTNACTTKVRVEAPEGIRTALHCDDETSR